MDVYLLINAIFKNLKGFKLFYNKFYREWKKLSKRSVKKIVIFTIFLQHFYTKI